MYEDQVNAHNYITYLEHIGIDIRELKENILERIEQEKDLFQTYGNRSHGISSPNIIFENIIFEESNKFIYDNFENDFEFEVFLKLDMETLIATRYSYIERPSIKKPSEIMSGKKSNIGSVENFIRVAKFEHELVLGDYREKNKHYLVYEGFTPIEDSDPFFYNLPSSLIWKEAFYYPKEENIIGLCENFNTVEARHTLWINSVLLDYLGLWVDDFNNGLRALNHDNEVILEFRQWREDLIGNGSSFVGEDSNIAKLEGCELLLREDYFKWLKVEMPNLVFMTKKMEW